MVLWPCRSRNNNPLAREKSPEQTRALYQSAVFSQKNGNYEKAVHQFRQVETALLTESSESDMLFLTYVNLGTCLRYIGNYDESIEYFENALKTPISQDTTDSEIIMANCHQRLAASLRSRGDYGEAIIHYQRSIEIRHREFPNVGTEGLALCYVGKAAILCGYGKAEEATELFQLALACCDTTSVELGHAHYQFGVFYNEKEEWVKAVQELTTAKTIFQHFYNESMALLCQREIAIAFFNQGKHSQASELLDQVLMNLEHKGWPTIEMAVTHAARGYIYSSEEDYDNAFLHFDAASRILNEKAPHSFDLARLCIATADAHRAKGDRTNALLHYQQAKSIYKYHRSRSTIVEEISTRIEILLSTEDVEDESLPASEARNAQVVARVAYPGYKEFDDSTIGDQERRCTIAVETPDEEMEITHEDETVGCGTGTCPDQGNCQEQIEVTEESTISNSHVSELLRDVLNRVDASGIWYSEEEADTLTNDARRAHIVVVKDYDNIVSSDVTENFNIVEVNSTSELLYLFEGNLINSDVIVSWMGHDDKTINFSLHIEAEIQLIKKIRRAGIVTPIIIYTSSFHVEESYKDEIMLVGGNAIVSDIPSLVDVVNKCISDAEHGVTMSWEIPFHQDCQSISSTDHMEGSPILSIADGAAHNATSNTLSMENVETPCNDNDPLRIENAVQHVPIPYADDIPEENEARTLSDLVNVQHQHDLHSSSDVPSSQTQPATQGDCGSVNHDPPGHFYEYIYNYYKEIGPD